MSSVTLNDVRFVEPEGARNYITHDYGALSWLLTKDHKRIAILYLFSITALFMLGGFFAYGFISQLGFNYWVGFLFAIIAMAAFGSLVERVIVRPILG